MAYSHKKYRSAPTVELFDRNWPNRQLSVAPRWCSVDLRDGNQALAEPMGQEKKRQLLDVLVKVGFREIELGFPSASQTEFDFLRWVSDSGALPANVTPQVITQARKALIERTFESLAGFRRAIVHMYNSTSELQRRVVFRKSRKEIIDLALQGTAWVKQEAAKYPDLEVIYQYSPESFTGTELDYALEVCEAVVEAWNPTRERKMILNLPSTVEMTSPNVFADRIEWFCRNLTRRSEVSISVHAHNDRGTAVATAELAQLAGAERIEGTLLGNGERSGNVDLVTLAMNLYSQGIDPELDFSNLPEIIRNVEQCTEMRVHPRHPWAGELVFTAFSGSHQDAIHKGMKERQTDGDALWEVPYLPIDPTDIGRHYEEVIRINSQSGKGGMAHVLERDYGYRIPKAMAADFSEVVQVMADQTGEELAPAAVVQLFRSRYFVGQNDRPRIRAIQINPGQDEQQRVVQAEVRVGDEWRKISGRGGGAIEAFANGLHDIVPGNWDIAYYTEHARSTGAASDAVAYVAISSSGDARPCFGVGEDRDVVQASFLAMLAALERVFPAAV
jgi:2-isopropylmalate synthase